MAADLSIYCYMLYVYGLTIPIPVRYGTIHYTVHYREINSKFDGDCLVLFHLKSKVTGIRVFVFFPVPGCTVHQGTLLHRLTTSIITIS